MLASSIQSGVSSQTANSTATNLSPAEAATDNTVAKTSLTEQKKSLAMNCESGSELFAGQLSEALTGAEQPGATQAFQESEREQTQQQQEPSAEAWLLAMLDQQQLQLQARDGLAPIGANTTVQFAANVVELANTPQQTSLATVDKTASEKNASPIDVSRLLNKEQPQKNTLATVNPVSATNTHSNAMLAGTPASVAVSSFAAQITPLTATTAIADVISNQLVVPTAFSAGGDESVQRNVQSQLSLHAPEAKWGEQLLHALRDNVQVQIQQRIQNATIRLDPPELGSLEIYLSHEAGRLNVHITASQTDVARLIQQTSDRLRHELAGPQFTQVNVQTSAEGQGGQQSRERQRFLAEDTILANEQAFANNAQPAHRASDVLVTV